MIPVEEALRIVEAAAGAPRARGESVPLARALGRVLADDLAIDVDAPPFDRATMDGYAVRAADVAPAALPRPLRVLAHVTAGTSYEGTLGEGECVAIMTGAPVPRGADAVVRVEWTGDRDAPRGRETRVRIERPEGPGANVARRGEQVRAGEIVLRAGARLTPAAIGVAAAAGFGAVEVARAPAVAIVATGDELVPVGRRPGRSQIRDSNGHALLAQALAAGAAGAYAGPVSDDRRALGAAIEVALAADVVLVTGGVSVGEKDFVPAILEGLGVERCFHGWAVKPGGPLWFGRRGETLVFGLPGNPAAAFVGFELLVVPALGVRLGRSFSPRATIAARPTAPLPAPISRRQFVPVVLDPSVSPAAATPIRWSGSGDPFGLAQADGLAVVPEAGRPADAAGDLVRVVPTLGGAAGASS